MRKRLYLVGLLLCNLLGCIVMSEETVPSEIGFRIELLEEQALTIKDVRLRLFIENISKKDVTLLNQFRPLDFFFYVELTKEDGTPVPGLLHGGKIEIRTFLYLTLKPNEFFGLNICLNEMCEKDIPLKDGKYKLNVSYHNQYGENCIKGWFESNTVSFTIKAKSDRLRNEK